MMDHTPEEIEDRRLARLEQQAALYGPMTDPSILIEIAELKHKSHTASRPNRRQFVNSLDYDFIMNVVAAGLVRLGQVEQNLTNNDRSRYWRQLIHDLWMVVITILVFLTLLVQIYSR